MGKTDENSQKAKFYNVIIVGGGISGLQAASELAKKRMEDFVLLEGSDRLGGRIKTLTVGSFAFFMSINFWNMINLVLNKLFRSYVTRTYEKSNLGLFFYIQFQEL